MKDDWRENRFKPKEIIKKPGNDATAKELMAFHCWNMIKTDPSLQEYISEDVDGLFEGLLPMNLEDYVSIIPR